MEAFLAFDPHNYPFLIDHNSRFVDVIARIAFKQGLVTCGSKEAARRVLTKSDGEELRNIIILIFAPYVAGLRALGQQTSSSSLISEAVPDARIEFADHMDHIILHVTDSSSSSCRSAKLEHRIVHSERSMFYYVELIKFAFGSNPMAARTDEVQRKLVRSLHRHWLSSYSSPVYLFEALERLLVSANLKATLTLILQTVLTKCRSFLKMYGEVPNQSLLYVNGKFTSEFSNHCSNRLSKKDLILMQLLVECKCMPKTTRSTLSSSKATGGQSDDEEHSYYGDTESDVDSGDACRSRRESRNNGTILLQSLADGMRPESLLHSSSSFLLFMEGGKDIDEMRTPYCVRTFKLTENVVTVIVSELTSRFQARSIHSILHTLTKIVSSKREFKGFEELHEFDKSCLHLRKLLDKNPSKTSKQLKSRMNQLLLSDIRKYCSSFSTSELPIKMEALISATCSCLREFYHESVYQFELKRMRKVSSMDSVHDHTQRIQAFAQEQVVLYIEYLEVKSKINMTIDPYMDTIPGIKAFFYIDRKINTIVFAAVDQKARHALPQAVALSYANLKSGILQSSFLVNELSAHYFHWFESVRGNTMKPSDCNFVLNSFPCLIQSDFVNEIIHKSFPCKRRDSFCCWGREAVSSFEILVLCKTASQSPHRTGSSPSVQSSPNVPVTDIEVRCKRLASKLSEFIAPEHFVSTLF